jgi:hypothetical protein
MRRIAAVRSLAQGCKRASLISTAGRSLGTTRSRPRRCWARAWFPRSDRACPSGARASGQHAAGPAACVVSDVRRAQPTQAGKGNRRARVRVARRSLRSPGRRLGHALGPGGCGCPRFESENPSRVAGFRAKLEPKTPRFPDRRRRACPVNAPPTRASSKHAGSRALRWRDPDSNRDTGIFSRVELLLSQNDLQAFPRS